MKKTIKLIGKIFLLSVFAVSSSTNLIYAGQGGLGGEKKSIKNHERDRPMQAAKHNGQIFRKGIDFKKELPGKIHLGLKERHLVNSGAFTEPYIYERLNDEIIKEVAEVLAVNDSIIFLSISSKSMTDNGIRYLGRACESNNTLKKIELSRSQITSDGATIILSNQNLEQILLDDNNIEDGDKIGEALLNNNTVKSLVLSSNPLSFLALEKIISALKNKQNLVDLSFRDTELISAQSIITLLSLPRLLTLSVSIDLNNAETMKALRLALKNNTKLTSFDINLPSHFELTKEGFDNLFDALRENYSLKYVSFLRPNGYILNEEQRKIIEELTVRNGSPEGQKLNAWNSINVVVIVLFIGGDSHFKVIPIDVRKIMISYLEKLLLTSFSLDLNSSYLAKFFAKKSGGNPPAR